MTTPTNPVVPAVPVLTPRAALLDLAERINADPDTARRYPSVVSMLIGEATHYPATTLPDQPPPLYKIPTAYAHLTQDAVDSAVRRLFDRYWEATTAAEKLQAVADHAQDAADAATRHADEINHRTQELCDAIKNHRPDLTIPAP